MKNRKEKTPLLVRIKDYDNLKNMYDSVNKENSKKQDQIKSLSDKKDEQQKKIDELMLENQLISKEKNDLNTTCERLKLEINEKKSEIQKLNGQKGGYTKQINELNEQINFLKNNRRSPDLEELKDYTEKRKTKTSTGYHIDSNNLVISKNETH